MSVSMSLDSLADTAEFAQLNATQISRTKINFTNRNLSSLKRIAELQVSFACVAEQHKKRNGNYNKQFAAQMQ